LILRTSIIPEEQKFVDNDNPDGINLKAICIFAAAGFFLEKDSYYMNETVLQPFTEYDISNNKVNTSKHYWQWHYTPREISIKQATEEFADLFERISNEKLKNKNIILPLSGGLDSRTQAAALDEGANVKTYSYKFADSFDETKYGREISGIKNFSFHEYKIPEGYLWNVINKLAEINKCYADFTHPRQMAVIDSVSKLGDVFYLGHWGDVLFDDMGIEENISFEEQAKVIVKKILKKGGLELAEALWKAWGIEGDFQTYLKERIVNLLAEIKIDNANSQVRAFKSTYWAPRWTSANMAVFSKYLPVVLPYYDDEMCKFICTIPEKLLSGRQIQIEYIKMKAPELAKIAWQNYDPLNLYTYKKFKSKSMLPMRALKKGKRILNEKLTGKKMITRNWELQFLGNENDLKLKEHLLENKSFSDIVPIELIRDFYNKFKTKDSVYYSHPLSMLLTISLFCKNRLPKK